MTHRWHDLAPTFSVLIGNIVSQNIVSHDVAIFVFQKVQRTGQAYHLVDCTRGEWIKKALIPQSNGPFTLSQLVDLSNKSSGVTLRPGVPLRVVPGDESGVSTFAQAIFDA